MKIGPLELVVVFIVALIVIGPNKLPEYAKKFGQAMREFKKASAVLTDEIKENIVEPLEEAQKPLREAMEPITDLDKEIRGNIKEVTDSVNNIGKIKKDSPATEPETAESEMAESETAETEEKVETVAEEVVAAVQENTETVAEAVEDKTDIAEQA
ncbi:MAG: twin-arginine translocase TatA/TatE family subunit [Lachnospiraceae bacterium]